jgi:hypothetical protein
MEIALKKLGFEVTALRDATAREMLTAIREFGREQTNYDVRLFYYTGHGIQYESSNYLIPVDASIENGTDVQFEGVDVGRVLAAMASAVSGVKIVILDSCRNDPYYSRFKSLHKGLSPVIKASDNTLVVYSTSPDNVAEDGDGRNSPFTAAFLRHISTPDKDIEGIMQQVREEVKLATGGKQIPWSSSSLTTPWYPVRIVVKETPPKKYPEEMDSLRNLRAQLQKEYDRRQQQRTAFSVIGWVSVGVSVISGTAAGVSYYFGRTAMDAYNGAKTSPEAMASRKEAEMYSAIFTAMAIATGISLPIGVLAFILQPDSSSTKQKLEILDQRIKSMEMDTVK